MTFGLFIIMFSLSFINICNSLIILDLIHFLNIIYIPLYRGIQIRILSIWLVLHALNNKPNTWKINFLQIFRFVIINRNQNKQTNSEIDFAQWQKNRPNDNNREFNDKTFCLLNGKASEVEIFIILWCSQSKYRDIAVSSRSKKWTNLEINCFYMNFVFFFLSQENRFYCWQNDEYIAFM